MNLCSIGVPVEKRPLETATFVVPGVVEDTIWILGRARTIL
jgi:hypothetical protein